MGTLGGSTVLLCLTIGRTRRSALVPNDRVWRKWEMRLMGGAWRFTYTRASHQKRSLFSGSGRRHAWTSRPTGRYRNLGSLFGFCYGATAHTLLVSYSSRVVAVLSDLA